MKRTSFIVCYTLFITFTLVLAGCRSSKKAPKDTDIISDVSTNQVSTRPTAEEQTLSSVIATRQTAKGLRSRVGIKLRYGSKSASASGQMKMKRDEIIQVTVMALGIMEVGRLELTPSQLLVIDRVNKQYIQVGWNEVPELAEAGIDFSTFQALFWNELFVPGLTGAPAVADFDITKESPILVLTPKSSRANTKKLATSFHVGTSPAQLQQTRVTPTDGRNKMNFMCTYSDWGKLDGKQFPKTMYLSVGEGSTNYSLNLDHSSLQTDESMGDLTSRVPSGYKRVTLEQIMRMLTK